MKFGGSARLLGAALLMAMAGGEAAAQQIVSAVGSESDNGDDADYREVTQAGVLAATTFGGVDTRALTDFGVNKVHVRGNENFEQYGASLWLDRFTVGGSGPTTVTLSFAIDGVASFGSDGAFNPNIFALRGNDWRAIATDGGFLDFSGGPATGGGEWDDVILERTRPDGGLTQIDARDYEGVWNFRGPNSPAQSPFPSRTSRGVTQFGDYYESLAPNQFGVPSGMRYYAEGFERVGPNGIVLQPYTTYASLPNAQRTAYLAARASFQANFGVLGLAALCADECDSGVFPGTELTLSFTLDAGAGFTLVSWFYADDVFDGTVDFFNTARMTGISLTNGATLTSASGALQALPGGGYGYPAAAVGGVPEPATWGMMIAGVALAGGALRRRRAAFAIA